MLCKLGNNNMERIIWFIVVLIGWQICCSDKTNGAIVRKIIKTNLAPGTSLPLNQAVLVGDTIYVSGQLGQGFDGILVGGIANQTRLALQYIGHILKAANSDYKNVVKTTVLLANISDSAIMSEVYREFFPTHYPARAAYQVGHLPLDALIEIEAVAISGEIVDV